MVGRQALVSKAAGGGRARQPAVEPSSFDLKTLNCFIALLKLFNMPTSVFAVQRQLLRPRLLCEKLGQLWSGTQTSKSRLA